MLSSTQNDPLQEEAGDTSEAVLEFLRLCNIFQGLIEKHDVWTESGGWGPVQLQTQYGSGLVKRGLFTSWVTTQVPLSKASKTPCARRALDMAAHSWEGGKFKTTDESLELQPNMTDTHSPQEVQGEAREVITSDS